MKAQDGMVSSVTEVIFRAITEYITVAAALCPDA